MLRRDAAFCFNDGDIKAKRAQREEVVVCSEESHTVHIRQGSKEEVANRNCLLRASQGSPEIAGAQRGLLREFQHGQMREGAVKLVNLGQIFHPTADFEKTDYIEAERPALDGLVYFPGPPACSASEIAQDIRVAGQPHAQRFFVSWRRC